MPSGLSGNVPFGFEDRLCDHVALFYFDEKFLSRTLHGFVASSLSTGGAAVLLASRDHCDSIAQGLGQAGFDLAALSKENRYLVFDVDSVLAQCTAHQDVDPRILDALLGKAVAAATKTTQSGARLTIYGELVARFWARRDFKNLSVVEQWWNRLAERFSFTLLCGYPIGEFSEPGSEKSFLKICRMHSTLIPPDQYPSFDAERRILDAFNRQGFPLHNNRSAT